MAPLLLNGLDGLNALTAATRGMLAATGTTMACPLPVYRRSSFGRFDYITARDRVNWPYSFLRFDFEADHVVVGNGADGIILQTPSERQVLSDGWPSPSVLLSQLDPRWRARS
jgi:hypothetical protein